MLQITWVEDEVDVIYKVSLKSRHLLSIVNSRTITWTQVSKWMLCFGKKIYVSNKLVYAIWLNFSYRMYYHKTQRKLNENFNENNDFIWVKIYQTSYYHRLRGNKITNWLLPNITSLIISSSSELFQSSRAWW